MTGFEPAAPASQKQCSTKLSYTSLTVVPIASIPELPRGMQQLSGLNENNYTISYALCQMVPSVPIHICGLPTFLGRERTLVPYT